VDSKEQMGEELIVGYDLCNDYSQISYFNYKHAEPKTISTTAGEEKYQIPTVLLKKEGTDKWYFGEEAIKKSASGEEILIQDILRKCSNNEVTRIEDKDYEPSYLLELFLRKTFGLFSYEGITRKVPDVIVFTLEQVNAALAKAIKQSAMAIGICEEKTFIQNHEESFVEYTINQKKELWNLKVVLLDYNKEYLKAFCLEFNTKTTPVLATIERSEFKEIQTPQFMFLSDLQEEKQKKLDRVVRDTLHHYFGSSMISCVFLCGEGFEGDWPKETFRFLCSGRRVFQGKNLYTKGACYQAAGKINNNGEEEYLYLGEDKLKYNIGLDVISKGENQYYSLILAGENWYDAKGECEMILDKETCIELKLTPIDNNDTRIIIVKLHDLPQRPNRTVRVYLHVKFESAKAGIITIKDLGFGEFFEASGKMWKHEILL
jgi:hypothetical protein